MISANAMFPVPYSTPIAGQQFLLLVRLVFSWLMRSKREHFKINRDGPSFYRKGYGIVYAGGVEEK
jgi:hypothetical protein